ncbi:MAG TPA: nitrile hydratase accessory protein [Candidatus Limnocylindria bacterium]|nr:nitrile hydratase accessory protein [Candidatus Limnocylindria bacterium]
MSLFPSLYEKGLFAWSELAAMLGEEIKKAQSAGDPDTGETYYHHWLETLERVVAKKGATSTQALTEHYQAWDRLGSWGDCRRISQNFKQRAISRLEELGPALLSCVLESVPIKKPEITQHRDFIF